MAQIINSNIASLTAQRNLNTSQNALSTSLQRLSSGLRINSAKDDAAGLAISERMTAQIRGLNQAARNASDGIALAQTAESAMGSVSDILQRIRELAIQAANDTNSTGDRQSLNTEVIQLQQELDRIASNTEFNGQRVIDGSFSAATFQVGANANQTITFGIASVRSGSIGAIAEATGTAVANATATDITIGIGGGTATSIASSAGFSGSANGQGATSAYAKAAAINDASIASLSATASTSVVSTVAAIGGTAGDTYTLVLNGVTIYSGVSVATALTNAALRDQINSVSNQTGVIASLSGGDMTLTAADGRDITVTESGTGFVVNTDGLAGDADITSGTAIRGTLTLSATGTIALGGTIANIGFTGDVALDTSGIDDIDVLTVANAQTAIKRVDAALDVVNTNRSSLGAIQNRFESTIASLQSASENLSAARSGIRDTDFAAETANLTRNQILQQAGIAILAQANALPNSVLSLLQ